MRIGWRIVLPIAPASSLMFFCLSGCKPLQTPASPPAPEVAVITVHPQPVELTSELPGRTSSYRIAEIRPQVNGLLQKRFFTEGSLVQAGDVLYQIDPSPYQAALDNATANLLATQKAADQARAALEASIADIKRHEATLVLTRSNLHRYQKLVETRATSAMQLDQALADAHVAEAALRTAQAQIESEREAVAAANAAIKRAEAARETAQIDLNYTKITAPISGQIGRSNVTEGAIVTAYQSVPLATIQQFNPIYVDVPQSTAELNRLRRSQAEVAARNRRTDRVRILLDDGSQYPLEGSLKFRDVTVDPTTGSVILRIVVPNPESILLPGMFVRAIIDDGVDENAILVPQQAVARDPKGNPTVLVVDEKNTVAQRAITTDRALGDQWLVSSGLNAGDRVIVEGIQRARPGTPVRVVPFEPKISLAAEPGAASPQTAPLN